MYSVMDPHEKTVNKLPRPRQLQEQPAQPHLRLLGLVCLELLRLLGLFELFGSLGLLSLFLSGLKFSKACQDMSKPKP